MPNIISPFIQRVYIQAQPALRTLSNTAGTWNPAGAQFLRVMDNGFKANPVEPLTPTNWKHGTASQLARIKGRKSGTWSLNTPIVPSGTQAVAPDADVLFQGIFGGAGSLQTGTVFGNAWVYNLYDQAFVPFALLGFNHNFASVGNFYSLGNVPQRVTITFNGNLLEMSINGISVTSVTNEVFGVVDSTAQGGLSAYPAEPGSFTLSGNLMPGFGGTLSINGTTMPGQCDSFSVSFDTGLSLKGDYLDDAYPASPLYGMRAVTATAGFVNNDSAILTLLKQWARAGTAVPVVVTLGTVAGYRFYINLAGVQFIAPDITDAGNHVTVNFGNAETSVTPGASNDIQMGFA